MNAAQETLAAVAYAPAPVPPFQIEVASTLDFDATVARLKQALAEQDLWLIAEIDPRMLLARGGYAIRATRQLLFFHPRYMVRLLGADPNALVEAPLKLVVMQLADGSVSVRCTDAEAAFGRYTHLGALAAELATCCRTLLLSVCGPQP